MNSYTNSYTLSFNTNRQKKELFVMAVQTPCGKTFPGNFTIIPSSKKWVLHAIFHLAFLQLYGTGICSMNRLILTDKEDAEYGSFEALIAMNDIFKSSKVMLCIYHAIWQPFKSILAVEKFQVAMEDKEQYIAYHVRKDVSLSHNAASTSPVKSMNSHIKGTMGCLSNQNTSNSLLRMARGSDQRISMYDTNSHRELQFTSLSSKLKIKDDLIRECLHICNQNFDKHKCYHCFQVSEDNWMVWSFYQNKSTMDENIEGVVPKFLNVYNICLK
jgi:hypothetical protein